MSHSQNGVALVVALVLLLVITLLGLGAIRSTSVQQKLTGNFYDREIAFQSAEAGLQSAAVAMQNLGTNPGSVVNCDVADGGQNCLTDPFIDPNVASATYVQTVQQGLGQGQYTAAANATGQPQFVIECMGPAQTAATPTIHTANSQNYGETAAEPQATGAVDYAYYRVTARSGDPAQIGNRAIVKLQAYYQWNYYKAGQACPSAGAGAGGP